MLKTCRYKMVNSKIFYCRGALPPDTPGLACQLCLVLTPPEFDPPPPLVKQPMRAPDFTLHLC